MVDLLSRDVALLRRGGSPVPARHEQALRALDETYGFSRQGLPGATAETAVERLARERREGWPGVTDANLRLLASVGEGDRTGMQEALDAGADPNFRTGPLDDSLATLAVRLHAKRDAGPLLEVLHAAGGRLDDSNRSFETPLHEAAAVGDGRLVDVLSRMGADPTRRDAVGRTPRELGVALHGEKAPVVEALFRCEEKKEGFLGRRPEPVRTGGMER